MPVYHVYIRSTQGSGHHEFRPNVDMEWLQDRILRPRADGLPITVNGRSIPANQLFAITIKETDAAIPSNSVRTDQFRNAKDVTDEFIVDAPGSSVSFQPLVPSVTLPSADTREVFVVHGRNAAARDALFEFLRSIDLHPLEWSEAVQLTGKPMPYIGEILDAAFSHAHAIVVLLTPDDEARLRDVFLAPGDPSHETELTGQARPNVLFEAGMAMSRDETRTILVELGNVRPFSDIAGRHTIRFDGSSQRRQELASRLASAGCPVNLSGTDWHAAGDFVAALDLVNIDADEAKEDRTVELSEDAREFLFAAVHSNRGAIVKINSARGSIFMPSPPTIVEDDRGRLSARLQHALDELIKRELVSDGPPFNVTHDGYLTVDECEQ